MEVVVRNKNVDFIIEDMLPLLYDKYIDEMSYISVCKGLKEEDFNKGELVGLKNYSCVYAREHGLFVGCLFYMLHEENNKLYCYVPSFGYYAQDEQTLSKLFEKLADTVMKKKECEFSVHLYAHDKKAIRLFNLLQFGIISETGIRKIKKIPGAIKGYELRTLNKKEVEDNWSIIWKYTKEVIDHLKESPIFYSGEEFTEEVYKDFYMDANTNVHVHV